MEGVEATRRLGTERDGDATSGRNLHIPRGMREMGGAMLYE